MKRVHAFLSSIELAVGLFIAISGLAALGTLVFQNHPPAEYVEYYGPTLSTAISLLGLDDIYHSPFYYGVLGLFGINILLCTLKRPLTKRFVGFHLTHLSILVILAGATLDGARGLEGMVWLGAGESASSVTPGEGAGLPVPFGFSLQLDRFDIEYGEPNYFLHAVVPDREGSTPVALGKPGGRVKLPNGGLLTFDGITRQDDVRTTGLALTLSAGEATATLDDLPPGQPRAVTLGGTGYTFTLLKRYENAVVGEKGGVVEGAGQGRNPAIQVRIQSGETVEERYLFANFPGFAHKKAFADLDMTWRASGHQPVETVRLTAPDGSALSTTVGGHDRPIRHAGLLLFASSEPSVKAYVSQVRILDEGRPVLTDEIRVNHPLSYGGFTFFQSSFRKDDQGVDSITGLQVKYSPGLPIVFVGLAMLLAGVIVQFYLNRIWFA